MSGTRCLALSLLMMSSVCLAQEAIMAGKCAVRASSGTVVVLICANSAKPDTWREAGIQACKDRSECNAWVWDDAEKAPLKAPAKDAELPKSATAEAVAIWVNDSKSLVTLKKAAK